MVIKNDKQRKAMFARMNQGGTRSNVTPEFKKGVVVSGRKPMFRINKRREQQKEFDKIEAQIEKKRVQMDDLQMDINKLRDKLEK